jgi:hypothetical protein
LKCKVTPYLADISNISSFALSSLKCFSAPTQGTFMLLCEIESTVPILHLGISLFFVLTPNRLSAPAKRFRGNKP